MQGPERYLAALNIVVPSLVEPRRTAAIDSTLRVFVGHDLFYLPDAATAGRFESEPLRYCRVLTDPVTLQRFKPTPQSPHLERHGRSYYFSSPATRRRFQAAPDSFAVRHGM